MPARVKFPLQVALAIPIVVLATVQQHPIRFDMIRRVRAARLLRLDGGVRMVRSERARTRTLQYAFYRDGATRAGDRTDSRDAVRGRLAWLGRPTP
jgi:hypothetical protein